MNWYDRLGGNFKQDKVSEWTNLLNKNLTENFYQKYLANNAGLFFGSHNCHLVVSKLKLGSELETDFVTLTDGYSNGNLFELIEIKQPGASLFTKKGLMTAEFSRAAQQVRDWKRWLMDNRSWFRKYLPTLSTRVVSQGHLKFKIIIGRRLINQFDIERRNQIGEEIGAEIRSFDYITDNFKSREFYPTTWLESGNWYYEDKVANPFYKALTDSKWKKFCNSKRISTFHFYSHHCADLIKYRKTTASLL
jgi:hypothetical protein